MEALRAVIGSSHDRDEKDLHKWSVTATIFRFIFLLNNNIFSSFFLLIPSFLILLQLTRTF